jgi:protein-S-isoprenylcysteine O-methyltransferase Ste14
MPTPTSPPRHALELKVPPVVVLLVVALAMWLLAGLVPGRLGDAQVRRWVAGALLAVGIAVAVAGVREFRRARTTVNPLRPDEATAMVTGGVYRHTRNPMYLGMLLVLAAWAAWLGNVPALLGLPAFVAYMNRFQIAPEERALATRFPHEAPAYTRRVRRWL